jgi:hypothetical protein
MVCLIDKSCNQPCIEYSLHVNGDLECECSAIESIGIFIDCVAMKLSFFFSRLD